MVACRITAWSVTQRFCKAAAVCVLASSPAAATDQPNPSFYLINRAHRAITEVYVSPVRAEGWGRNHLVSTSVAPNNNVAIRLLADGSCVFDLKVVFEDGRDEQRRAVNTCNADNIAFGAASGTGALPRGNPARDPSFRIVNRGNREIYEVYARVSGRSDWGRDRLGEATIDADSYRVIALPSGQCMWDVRIVFADGQTSEQTNTNLCAITDLPVR